MQARGLIKVLSKMLSYIMGILKGYITITTRTYDLAGHQ